MKPEIKKLAPIAELSLKILESSVSIPWAGAIIGLIPDFIDLLGTHDQVSQIADWLIETRRISLHEAKNPPTTSTLVNHVKEAIKQNPHTTVPYWGHSNGKIIDVNERSLSNGLFQNERIRATKHIQLNTKTSEVYIFDDSSEIRENLEFYANEKYTLIPTPGTPIHRITIVEETLLGKTRVTASHAEIIAKTSYGENRNLFDELSNNSLVYSDWNDVVNDLMSITNSR